MLALKVGSEVISNIACSGHTLVILIAYQRQLAHAVHEAPTHRTAMLDRSKCASKKLGQKNGST